MLRRNSKLSKITPYMGVETFVVLLVLFIIVSCFLGAKVVELTKEQENMVRLDVRVEVIQDLERKAVGSLQSISANVKKETITLKEYLQRLRWKVGEIENNPILARLRKAHVCLDQAKELLDQPPIITLTEAGGYYFASGRSEVPTGFDGKLRQEIIPKIAVYVKKYAVDVIEVIGHTDEVHLGGKKSNLDRRLLPFLRGVKKVTLQAGGDNTSLGMARAAAIAQILISDTRLPGLKITPLSAGQAVNLDGTLATGNGGNSQQRRRIEIRLKRSLTKIGDIPH
ncbi:MAG: hypothetical protein ABII72_02150 [Parcubacteria group bacterium]